MVALIDVLPEKRPLASRKRVQERLAPLRRRIKLHLMSNYCPHANP
jgi:hypothetical protein